MATNFNLPNSYLINKLIEKLEVRGDNFGLEYAGLLVQLSQTVDQEVSYISKVFPEYTPHNNSYHFRNLFRIADQVLGEELIDKMNEVELFILASALYSHDWGMAVSNDEKDCILGIKGTNENNFSLIPDETRNVQEFLKQNSLNVAELQDDNEFWSEYVRKTHAIRSGERVKNFLKEHSTGLGEAIKRVCIGHWLDFSEVRNSITYPTNYSLLNKTVNLRAITIYVRLIDLLDLTEERTPYIIWKFVAPRNKFSKNEWEKHRALTSVTCPSYSKGRVIKVDGYTENPEVFASLKDLQRWCDEQFRGCIDLISEMNDAYHRLDIYHIEWNIVTQGFSPTSIRFNFERERMFQILGEEIYQNDQYVFLRELLQNSIDAINMRKALLERQIGLAQFGEINVLIEEKENNYITITWRDNGIGMNEYILKNFFSVAGRSYYNSMEFEKEGLKMDPISKFGIGVLSCSTVTDYLSIETFRDPYIDPNSKLLKITIPSIDKYFHVKEYEGAPNKIGTSIKLYIDKRKHGKNLTINTEDIINYLSFVGGFCEYPIIVETDKEKTIIIHPLKDRNEIEKKYGNKIRINQLDFQFKWENVFRTSSIHQAKNYLNVGQYRLDKDLRVEGHEGVISYLYPADKENTIDMQYNYMAIINKNGEEIIKLRLIDDYPYTDNQVYLSPSCTLHSSYLVFMDGILVSNVDGPFDEYGESYRGVCPQSIVNFRKRDLEINISRTNITSKNKPWSYNIIEAYTKKALDEFAINSLDKTTSEVFLMLVDTIYYHNLVIDRVLDIIDKKFLFVPILQPDGTIYFNNDIPDTIYQGPLELKDDYKELLLSTMSQRKYNGIFNKWKGKGNYVITKVDSYSGGRESIIEELIYYTISDYYNSELMFLEAPTKEMPPLVSIVRKKQIESNTLEEDVIIRLVKEIDNELSEEQIAKFNSIVKEPFKRKINSNGLYEFPEFIAFSNPFQERIAYGIKYFNSNNIVIRKVMSLLARAFEQNTQEKDIFIKLELLIESMEEFENLGMEEDAINYEKFVKVWDEFINNLLEASSYYKYYNSDFSIDIQDLVPNTVYDPNKVENRYLSAHVYSYNKDKARFFGIPVETI